MFTLILATIAASAGYVLAKLTNPKDPVRDEILAYAQAGSTVVYSIDGEAILVTKEAGQVKVFVGKLDIGGLNDSSPVGTSFDH